MSRPFCRGAVIAASAILALSCAAPAALASRGGDWPEPESHEPGLGLGLLDLLGNLGLPDLGALLPGLGLPELGLPELELPELGLPDIGLPDLDDVSVIGLLPSLPDLGLDLVALLSVNVWGSISLF